MTTTLNHIDVEHIIRKHMERQSALTDGPKVLHVEIRTFGKDGGPVTEVEFDSPEPERNEPAH